MQPSRCALDIVLTRPCGDTTHELEFLHLEDHSEGHVAKMTPVGFKPTQLALVELESTPSDHPGKVSMQ